MGKSIALLIVVVYTASIFVSGWYYGSQNMKKSPIQIAETTTMKYNTINRDVKKMNRRELEYEINQYYKIPPRLEGEIHGEWFVATAGLGDRNWSREFKIEVGGDNNWKYYVAIGSLTLVGIGTYIYLKNR